MQHLFAGSWRADHLWESNDGESKDTKVWGGKLSKALIKADVPEKVMYVKGRARGCICILESAEVWHVEKAEDTLHSLFISFLELLL